MSYSTRHPIVVTKPMNVAVVGGGKAALTKLKLILRNHSAVTCIAPEVSEKIRELPVSIRTADFYDLSVSSYTNYSMIYLTLPYPETESERNYFEYVVSMLMEQGKLVSVASRPEMGNFIHPAVRYHEPYTVAVSSSGKNLYQSVAFADQFIAHIAGTVNDE